MSSSVPISEFVNVGISIAPQAEGLAGFAIADRQ